MAHPKYQKNITKEQLNERRYDSMVEEFRRHLRLHRVIRVKYHDNNLLFEHLILALRKLYGAPNKDFSKVGTKLMIDKYGYEIIDYQFGKTLELETIAKGQLYNVKYFIKKYFNGYRLHYYDYSKSQKTVFGMQANLAKYFYKRSVSKNAKMIKKELINLRSRFPEKEKGNK